MPKSEMQRIADGRPPTGAFSISFVNPSGVLALPTAEGAYTVRTFIEGCVLHVDAPDDGLIAEMQSGREPIPWKNAEQREAALRQIREERPDLPDDIRSRLADWIKTSGWYES
ncbi:hypothetical protein GQ651_08525 [Alphaproteobacteria bacterium GH1-50]|uniref:Uncharacterized protein n=1 Tax=Kangsaoukella pontilimi TaxID=2691042 RepID=A0A7C9IG71_9RHOB|nr:hypothetical protein [Kangsaoukella pontilimi]MXQ07889.1 hypothetical protein [Kangsaoukella pontilimi]